MEFTNHWFLCMQLSTVQGADTLNSKAQPCQRSTDMHVYMTPHVYILERVHQTGQLLQSKQAAKSDQRTQKQKALRQ